MLSPTTDRLAKRFTKRFTKRLTHRISERVAESVPELVTVAEPVPVSRAFPDAKSGSHAHAHLDGRAEHGRHTVHEKR